jgi:hypothetical protein
MRSLDLAVSDDRKVKLKKIGTLSVDVRVFQKSTLSLCSRQRSSCFY